MERGEGDGNVKGRRGYKWKGEKGMEM